MKISLLLLALVASSFAANIDDNNARIAALAEQEEEGFIFQDDGEDAEFDEDEENEEDDEDQSSMVESLSFLQGRAGICDGQAKGACTKNGGQCVTEPFADNCKAIHGDSGKLKKKQCKGKSCQCCQPPPTCDGKIKKSCSKNGGTCILKPFKSNCRGGVLDKKACKGKHCQCCTLATTGGTGGNKDSTAKPATTVEKTQPPQTTTVRHDSTLPPAPTTLPPAPTTLPPAPTTLPPAPTTLPPAPTTLPTAPTTLPPAPTTLPPAPTTLPPAAPTTTLPPAPTTLPPAPTTLPPALTTLPLAPTTLPPTAPTTLRDAAPTTTPPPPPTTTPPPPPTTTPPPPTTTPPPPPTTTPPPPPTTTPPPPPTTTPPPPPTTTPQPPPTTTPPPPPTTTPRAPTTRAVPEDNLLTTKIIRDETLEWSCGWWCDKKVTYTLVLARGYGNEEEFIYIEKSKFGNGYSLDTLIDICDLQYGTYEMDNGRKGVFMVYHDTSLKPYQKRFNLHTDGITQDILNAIGNNIDNEDFPGTSTSSSFWDFSWLTGNYLKNVDC